MSLPSEERTRALSGRYELGDLLGRGGTSEVYRAVDRQLGRGVAVKVLRGGASDDRLERESREVALLARLQHPNLVRLFDAGADDGTPYAVMELVDGQTLDDAVASGIDEERAREVGIAVASALAYIHEAGVIHRDVKPGNILLDRRGGVRLTDFGIARLVDGTQVTPTGFAMGTAAYLAPEQVAGESVGPSADIYSLGLVLLQSLTGRQEYQGSPVEAAIARLRRPPAVPSSLGKPWVTLLTAMTAREPERRPDAGAVLTRLSQMDRATPGTSWRAGPAALRSRVRRAGSPRRTRLAATGLGVALLLGAGGAATLGPWSSTASSAPSLPLPAPVVPPTAFPTPTGPPGGGAGGDPAGMSQEARTTSAASPSAVGGPGVAAPGTGGAAPTVGGRAPGTASAGTGGPGTPGAGTQVDPSPSGGSPGADEPGGGNEPGTGGSSPSPGATEPGTGSPSPAATDSASASPTPSATSAPAAPTADSTAIPSTTAESGSGSGSQQPEGSQA